MAELDLKYPVYKGTVSGVIGKAVQADVTIECNDEKFYADGGIRESDKGFKSGKIVLGVDDISDDIQVQFLGHTISGGAIIANADDVSPFVQVGFYCVKKVGGVYKYRAIYFTKVQFGEPSDSNKTKEGTVKFSSRTIEGEIFKDDTGNWKQEETFTNEADAIAFLNNLVGLPVSASGGLSGLSMTGTGGTLSPAFGANTRSYTFGGVTGASVTITATAVNHTIKLYVDGVYSQTLVSGTASAAIPMSTGSKKLTIVAQEAGKQSQTTEIIVVKTA